nr:MAG TPA: putative YhdX-like protein [Caudoviricetes sp.]
MKLGLLWFTHGVTERIKNETAKETYKATERNVFCTPLKCGTLAFG